MTNSIDYIRRNETSEEAWLKSFNAMRTIYTTQKINDKNKIDMLEESNNFYKSIFGGLYDKWIFPSM